MKKKESNRNPLDSIKSTAPHSLTACPHPSAPGTIEMEMPPTLQAMSPKGRSVLQDIAQIELERCQSLEKLKKAESDLEEAKKLIDSYRQAYKEMEEKNKDLQEKVETLETELLEHNLNQDEEMEELKNRDRIWEPQFAKLHDELDHYRNLFRMMDKARKMPQVNHHPDAIAEVLEMRVSPDDGVQEFLTSFPNTKKRKWVTIDAFMDKSDTSYTPLERFLCKKHDVDLYDPNLPSSSPTPPPAPSSSPCDD